MNCKHGDHADCPFCKDELIVSLTTELKDAKASLAAKQDFILGVVGNYMAMDHGDPLENLLQHILKKGGVASMSSAGDRLLERLNCMETNLDLCLTSLGKAVRAVQQYAKIEPESEAGKMMTEIHTIIADCRQQISHDLPTSNG